MSDSNTATPLQQEVDERIDRATNGGAYGAGNRLKGDEVAVVRSWFRIASNGKRPTVDAVIADTGFTEARVTKVMAMPAVQKTMEESGHGVIDMVQLAVALRVADKLEEYTSKWQAGEIQFSDIPRPFQDLAMEAYKSKIPETRAKQDTGKASRGGEGPAPKAFSDEALRLLGATEK